WDGVRHGLQSLGLDRALIKCSGEHGYLSEAGIWCVATQENHNSCVGWDPKGSTSYRTKLSLKPKRLMMWIKAMDTNRPHKRVMCEIDQRNLRPVRARVWIFRPPQQRWAWGSAEGGHVFIEKIDGMDLSFKPRVSNEDNGA
ncbi:hypothetical protein DVH24_004633, partial [Malus domestica]